MDEHQQERIDRLMDRQVVFCARCGKTFELRSDADETQTSTARFTAGPYKQDAEGWCYFNMPQGQLCADCCRSSEELLAPWVEAYLEWWKQPTRLLGG